MQQLGQKKNGRELKEYRERIRGKKKVCNPFKLFM